MNLFLHPLGLLALLAVPAVVALHLFRRRFEPTPVSALFLWDMPDQASASGRHRDRLHRSPSFWCEVLAALLLALAFAGPRLPWEHKARHLVVVLDSSASMSATGPEGALAERARAEVRARIEDLPRRSRVTLLASGAPPTHVAGPAAFPEEALSALDAWRPGSGRHDLTPAVALALKMATQGSVLLVTDEFEPSTHPPEVEILSVGRPLANLALTHAARHRDQGEDQVFLTVTNFSARSATTVLTLEAGGQDLLRERLDLDGDQRRHFRVPLPAGTGVVVARMEDDALRLDNVATLVPPPRRTVLLASTFDVATSRRLGLMSSDAATSRIDRWLSLVPDTRESPVAGAHLVIGPTADGGPQTWNLVMDAGSGECQDLVGPFLADRRHPLLQGLTLEGIVWSADRERPWAGVPLISAGNTPLLTEQDEGPRLRFTLNLDPARSSLHRSPDWPILLTNLVELRRRSLPGPEETNLFVDQRFTWRDAAPRDYWLDGPEGRVPLPARGVLVVDQWPGPGLYSLGTGEEPLCEIGVSFGDAAESDLTRLAEGRRPSTVGLQETATSLGILEWCGILLALGLVCADWWFLARRPAVALSTP